MEYFLKSCHICGGVSEIKTNSGSSIWVISCRNPRCETRPTLSGQNLKDLVREWNNRNQGVV
jgi:hypothetical protein